MLFEPRPNPLSQFPITSLDTYTVQIGAAKNRVPFSHLLVWAYLPRKGQEVSISYSTPSYLLLRLSFRQVWLTGRELSSTQTQLLRPWLYLGQGTVKTLQSSHLWLGSFVVPTSELPSQQRQVKKAWGHCCCPATKHLALRARMPLRKKCATIPTLCSGAMTKRCWLERAQHITEFQISSQGTEFICKVWKNFSVWVLLKSVEAAAKWSWEGTNRYNGETGKTMLTRLTERREGWGQLGVAPQNHKS